MFTGRKNDLTPLLLVREKSHWITKVSLTVFFLVWHALWQCFGLNPKVKCLICFSVQQQLILLELMNRTNNLKPICLSGPAQIKQRAQVDPSHIVHDKNCYIRALAPSLYPKKNVILVRGKIKKSDPKKNGQVEQPELRWSRIVQSCMFLNVQVM